MTDGPQWNPTSPPQHNAQPDPYPGPQPGGYAGAPPSGHYAGAPQQVEHPDAVTILVLGLVSLVILPPLGFLPWSMGNRAMRDVRANPGLYRNEGMITAGRILGIIGVVLTGLFILFFLLPFFVLIPLGLFAGM